MNRKWKVLSSKYISKKAWATIRVDHVQLPNGNEIEEYYVHEYPNWVNVIAITEQQQIVMIQQYRHGLKEYLFEIPAGVCEDWDTDPIDSAKRELLEETGYGEGNWEKFMVISANPGTNTNLCYCYIATNVKKIAEQNLETTEEIEVSLLSIEEVKSLLETGNIKQALNAAPLWKYMATVSNNR